MTENTLYFAQHGLAVDKSKNPERPLSEAGIKQTEAIAKHLSKTGIVINHIFHSGKLRAAQTAEIFATNLNISSIRKMAQMSPNDDAELIVQNLITKNALYVGHLPHLEKLVSYIVTSKIKPSLIKFQNSAIVCLEKDNSHYYLKWYLTTELLNN